MISIWYKKKKNKPLQLNFLLLPLPNSIPVGFHLFQCVLWNRSPVLFQLTPTTWGLLF